MYCFLTALLSTVVLYFLDNIHIDFYISIIKRCSLQKSNERIAPSGEHVRHNSRQRPLLKQGL